MTSNTGPLHYLHSIGFRHVARLRTDPEESFAFEHLDDAPRENVVYVAVRDGDVLFVGKAFDFRRRFDHGHVRWLRGEKRNSASQQHRWAAEVRRGPVDFYGRVHRRADLPEAVAALIRELSPKLNLRGSKR